jgi:homoserine dehydrogenase
MKTETVIGLFGFGVVGEGLFELLRKNNISKTQIKKICVNDKTKARSVNDDYIYFNRDELILDDTINLIVELTNSYEEAYDIVKRSLINGKSVVSGNKKMIAHHLDEFIDIQSQTGQSLLYDASACGSIPVIRNLEEYYDNDLLISISGIFNGSSNYILSEIFHNDRQYSEALPRAQELGFAENDPANDVDGFDALYKLVIIGMHGFGTYVPPNDVFTFGISSISQYDINYAKERGLKIKLIAYVAKLSNEKFTMFVMPKLVDGKEYVYNVENEYNGIVIEGECYEKQFMFGKGAGAFPTAASILSDITARCYSYKYEYKKHNYFKSVEYSSECEVEIYLRYKHVKDLARFDFVTITESYTSRHFNFVVGRIMLNKLMEARKHTMDADVFLAFTGKLSL